MRQRMPSDIAYLKGHDGTVALDCFRSLHMHGGKRFGEPSFVVRASITVVALVRISIDREPWPFNRRAFMVFENVRGERMHLRLNVDQEDEAWDFATKTWSVKPNIDPSYFGSNSTPSHFDARKCAHWF